MKLIALNAMQYSLSELEINQLFSTNKFLQQKLRKNYFQLLLIYCPCIYDVNLLYLKTNNWTMNYARKIKLLAKNSHFKWNFKKY